MEVSFELFVCPVLSLCPTTTTKVGPLSAVLRVLGVAIWCVGVAHTILEPSICHDLTHTLPLLPLRIITASSALLFSAPLPLLPVSPSAYHLSCGFTAGQSPLALWLKDPMSPPPTTESRTLPWPFDPAAPPWLLSP